MAENREYGVQTTFYFPLTDRGTLDFESTPVSFVSGDTQIIKDGSSAVNTTNDPAHVSNGIYSLTLTSSEMSAANIVVTIIDSATKEWEDHSIAIDTYGNILAQHELNINTPFVASNVSQIYSYGLTNSVADNMTTFFDIVPTTAKTADNVGLTAATEAQIDSIESSLPTNFSSMQIESTYGYVNTNMWQVRDTFIQLSDTMDSNVTSVLGTTVTESNSGNLADNISQFYDVNPTTVRTVDDVTGVEQQDVRDAMKLAPTGGAPASGSVDDHLDNLDTDNVTLASGTHTGAVIPTVTDVTNQVSADVTAVSGDATAADNLEAMFDNTGFNASNSSIGSVGGGTVDANVTEFLGTAITESNAGDVADAASYFFDVSSPSKSVNDIGTADLTGVTVDSDWTTAEKGQIRQALGVYGYTTAINQDSEVGDLKKIMQARVR